MAVRSMTGFGRGEAEGEGVRVTAEARSVNARFLEVSVKLPGPNASLEAALRGAARERLERGRVEIHLAAAALPGGPSRLNIDRELALTYYNGLKELAKSLEVAPEVTLLQVAQLPGVFSLAGGSSGLPEDAALAAAAAALDGLVAMRAAEGRHLADDMTARVRRLHGLVGDVAGHAADVVTHYRTRLAARLAAVVPEGMLDEARLLAEVAILAERSDITEELVRLRGHLDQAAALLTEGAPGGVGRRLDFFCQEMHREWNTIGSKAADLAVATLAVEGRVEVERLREQSQNVE